MKNNDSLFSDIQNLCNAVSDWLIKKKSISQLKPTRQYLVPVVTSCVITAEPVNKLSWSWSLKQHGNRMDIVPAMCFLGPDNQ